MTILLPFTFNHFIGKGPFTGTLSLSLPSRMSVPYVCALKKKSGCPLAIMVN